MDKENLRQRMLHALRRADAMPEHTYGLDGGLDEFADQKVGAAFDWLFQFYLDHRHDVVDTGRADLVDRIKKLEESVDER